MNFKYLILIFVLLTFNPMINCQNDTINLFYDIGVFKLNKLNYDKIQTKLNALNMDTNYEVAIISSCDFLGSNKANLLLSSQRASTVKDLLVIKDNVLIKSITYKGVGELETLEKGNKGIAKHRKTTIVFKDETQLILEKIANGKKGDVFILKDINFEAGRHFLRKKSIHVLKKLLKVMTDNPELEIELSGHVCCGKSKEDLFDGYDRDSKTYNLSENRANHIYKYLILKNIDKNRLSHKGYGFQKPLKFPELNEEDKRTNRRVEVKVIKN